MSIKFKYILIINIIFKKVLLYLNDVVISNGSFKCRFFKLLNVPIVDCIVVLSISRTIKRHKSFEFQYSKRLSKPKLHV